MTTTYVPPCESIKTPARNLTDPVRTFSTWDEIKPHLMACDEENLLCVKDGKTSFVNLVYGNDGPTVVADYGMSLEPIIGSLSEFDDPTDLIVAALLK